jgi:hypothetical protein
VLIRVFQASRRNSQLLENVGRILEWKELPATEPMCQIDDDVGISSGVGWRIDASSSNE